VEFAFAGLISYSTSLSVAPNNLPVIVLNASDLMGEAVPKLPTAVPAPVFGSILMSRFESVSAPHNRNELGRQSLVRSNGAANPLGPKAVAAPVGLIDRIDDFAGVAVVHRRVQNAAQRAGLL
jgi:hypothetical protein